MNTFKIIINNNIIRKKILKYGLIFLDIVYVNQMPYPANV